MREFSGHVLAVLSAFALACLVLAAIPGPATALFLHRAIRDGRPAGLAAVAGNEIGVFGWALAAGAGLTALLQANRMLYDAMHLIGGGVLVVLGITAWRSARRTADGDQPGDAFGASMTGLLPAGPTPLAAFRASLMSIAANPKAAVFAFSFLPQFLPRHGPVFATAAVLAAIQVVIDGSYCAGIVYLAGRIKPWLARGVVRRRMEQVLGTVLIGLGIELAAETR